MKLASLLLAGLASVQGSLKLDPSTPCRKSSIGPHKENVRTPL